MESYISCLLLACALLPLGAEARNKRVLLNFLPVTSHPIVAKAMVYHLANRGFDMYILINRVQWDKWSLKDSPVTHIEKCCEDEQYYLDQLADVPVTVRRQNRIIDCVLSNTTLINTIRNHEIDLIIMDADLIIENTFIADKAGIKKRVLFLTEPHMEPMAQYAIGELNNPSYVLQTTQDTTMPGRYGSFQWRFVNSLFYLVGNAFTIYLEILMHPIYSKHYPDGPMRIKVQYDMMFISSFNGFEFARPLPTTVKYVGSIPLYREIHGESPKTNLTQLEPWANLINEKKQFIMLTFGTTQEIEYEQFKAILDSFTEFPEVAFIVSATFSKEQFRYAGNVRISAYFPQRELLKIPGCLGMLNICGFGSVNEAIFFRTPLLCYPVVHDMHHSAYIIQEKGMGLILDSLKPEEIVGKVRALIDGSPRFKRNMEKFKGYMDETLRRDDFTYWLNFTLHHDMSEFKPIYAKGEMMFYQYANLDVWACYLAIFYVLYRVVTALLCAMMCCCKRTKAEGPATVSSPVKSPSGRASSHDDQRGGIFGGSNKENELD